MTFPKLLVPAAASALAFGLCMGVKTLDSDSSESQENAPLHQIGNTGKTVKRILKHTEPRDPVGQAEKEWTDRYENRCIYGENENRFDLNRLCDEKLSEITGILNRKVNQVQSFGKLKELVTLTPCANFHWRDEEHRTAGDMLAGPGAHSHFELDELDCVTAISVWTEDSYPHDMTCSFTTFCVDEYGDREQLAGYSEKRCDMHPFNTVEATNDLEEVFSD